jgi:hypothetical protein
MLCANYSRYSTLQRAARILEVSSAIQKLDYAAIFQRVT